MSTLADFNPLGLIIGLLVLALAVMWAILPVILVSKFNELLKLAREAKQTRAAILNTLRAPKAMNEMEPPPLPPPLKLTAKDVGDAETARRAVATGGLFKPQG